ncbi:MAG: hypothetical protein PHH00_02580 [Candidatus Nanoarchaeia archaeon]|nr:hypothetical protein [Candidatus Nanoarchaeia archaeon]
MFKKKICRKCGTGTREKYDFCPYCGNPLDKREEDFGMLGKNDFFNENNFNEFRLPAGFNMLFNFNSIAKNLEKQFRDIEKKAAKPEISDKNHPDNKGHITISITTSGSKIPGMKLNPSVMKNPKREIKTASFDDLSAEQLKRFSRLPKEEPKTNIRRLSNKVFYEIDMPGVRSSRDISILNLERGVELKAISDKKAYLKSIPINLPIVNYKLSKGKLTLEMDAQGN